MTARAFTARPARFFLGAGTTALALALGGAPLLLTGTAEATNAKGSITIHDVSKGIDLESNDPHVCQFTLVADNYAATIDSVSWVIEQHAPTGSAGMGTGPIALSVGNAGDKEGQTAVMSLPAGHYKVQAQWHDAATGENGTDNWKTFWSNCEATGGTTGGTTGGDTGGTSTGGDTGGTSTGGDTGGDTGGTSTGGDTGGTTGGTSTGGDTGGTTGGDETTGDITGGGGTVVVETPSQPAKTPVTGGGGTVTTAHELPFTGDSTTKLALWGLASLVGGIGFSFLGQRRSSTR